MLEQEYVEHLIKTANRIAVTEKEYMNAKRDLEIQKAKYNLENNWEEILGKSRPTVAEKESWIAVETDSQRRFVDDLKIQRDYCRRMYEINLLAYKE